MPFQYTCARCASTFSVCHRVPSTPFCSRRCANRANGLIRAANAEQRLWASAAIQSSSPPHCPDLDPCWLRDAENISWEGKTPQASRVAWFCVYGEWPTLHVCHRCDSGARCINPDHLFEGTDADNVADKIAKGRQPNARWKFLTHDDRLSLGQCRVPG